MKCNRFGSSKRFVGCCCCRPFLGKEPTVFFFFKYFHPFLVASSDIYEYDSIHDMIGPCNQRWLFKWWRAVKLLDGHSPWLKAAQQPGDWAYFTLKVSIAINGQPQTHPVHFIQTSRKTEIFDHQMIETGRYWRDTANTRRCHMETLRIPVNWL